MTPEEAIEILEELASELWRDKYKMAMKTAIKALEEIQQYREIGNREAIRCERCGNVLEIAEMEDKE